MATYEVEIKSLLGSPERSQELKEKLAARGAKLVNAHKQLNHYFEGGDLEKLYTNTVPLLSADDQKKLRLTIDTGKDFSIRTRDMNGVVILVIKASVDDTTSANGIARMEFEAVISGKTLEELDQVLLDAGFSYQAKWSREREEYSCDNGIVCLDKNAGYGYVAEFERVVDEHEDRADVVAKLRGFMKELGVEELSQDRLERMFAHYNRHWPEYYGTDKIFTLE